MDANALAKVATKAGMILLESGAETFRVEDTMRRIVLAYGANIVDAYATPTLIIISFSLLDKIATPIAPIKCPLGSVLTSVFKIFSKAF